MRKSIILVLIVMLVALIGCSEDPTSTQVVDTVEKEGPPMEAGIIYRGSTAVAFTWVDFDSGLRVVLGSDMDEFCAGVLDFDVVEFQDGNLPGGRIVELLSGEMRTTVWDFLDFDCALFTTIDPVAWGVSDFMGIDNDLEGTVVNNTNTWGFGAQGALTNADGDKVRFRAFLRQQFGNDSGYKVVSRVKLSH